MNNLNSTFKERVIELMKEKKLSLGQIAENATEKGFDLHKSYVHKVVNTEPCANVTLDKVAAFAAGLNTSSFYLIGATDNPSQKSSFELVDRKPESVEVMYAINSAVESFDDALKNVLEAKILLNEGNEIDFIDDAENIKTGIKVGMMGKLTGNYMAAIMAEKKASKSN